MAWRLRCCPSTGACRQEVGHTVGLRQCKAFDPGPLSNRLRSTTRTFLAFSCHALPPDIAWLLQKQDDPQDFYLQMLALDCRSDGSKSKDTLGELSVKCIRILHSTDIYEAINLIPMNILRRYWGDLKTLLAPSK